MEEMRVHKVTKASIVKELMEDGLTKEQAEAMLARAQASRDRKAPYLEQIFDAYCTALWEGALKRERAEREEQMHLCSMWQPREFGGSRLDNSVKQVRPERSNATIDPKSP